MQNQEEKTIGEQIQSSISEFNVQAQAKIFTRKQMRDAVSKVIDFEEEELLIKVTECLLRGNAVLVDAVRYTGNGHYEKRTLKNRYKYKLIAPIVDTNDVCYSTDLYKVAEAAMKATCELYRSTQQLVVDVIAEIPFEYSLDRMGHGYKDGKYGIYKTYFKEFTFTA